jgi:hypothetical protein
MVNEFDNIEDDFPEAKEAPTTEHSDTEELLPGQSSGYKYLKTPEVGQSITFTLEKVEKNPGRELKNSTDGSKFWTGLENTKTGKRTEFNLITANGECFSITSWGLYFLILGRESKVEQLAIKNKTYKGIKLKITHVYNGRDSKASLKDLKKLRDFKTDEEAKAHQDKVGAAIKEGKIYSVEIVE